MPDIVSILIPAYNSEHYLSEAIDSALAQTWPGKEIVVVDDGSTDGTLEIAQSYERRDVKVVSQVNCGASATRNRALGLAQGDYIQWLDADDILAPDKLARQLSGAETGRSSRVLLAASFGEFFVDPEAARFAPTALWRDLDPVEYFLAKFLNNAWFFPASWLVSRKLTELAGPWDERLTLDDDGEYFARVVAASEGVRFVPEARAYYRRASVGSLSRAISERAADSLLLSIGLCIHYLLEIEDSDRTRAASIRFLQDWIDRGNCFHPDRSELYARVQSLAHELGGSVEPPRLGWKYAPLQAVFGWKAVRHVRRTVSDTKLRARIRLDRFGAAPPGWKMRRSSSRDLL